MNTNKKYDAYGIIYFFIIIFLFPVQSNSQTITFKDTDPHTIIIDNNSSYEIGIAKKNGNLEYIKDLSANIKMTYERALWLIADSSNNGTGGEFYQPGGSNSFGYTWNENTKVLTLSFQPDPNEPNKVMVTITLSFSTNSYFDMQMTLNSQWEKPIKTVSFPGPIPVKMGAGDEAVLPIAYPGMLLESEFFIQGESHEYGYPDVFQADYLSMYISTGKLCVYTLRDGLSILPNMLGFHYTGDPNNDSNYFIIHDYKTWIHVGSTWISPISRFHVGKSHVQTLKAYRTDNGIDKFPSLQSKLGDKFDQVSKSMLYYYSFAENPPFSNFSNFAEFAKSYASPGIVMLSTYYTGGYHGHHPDYYPPDPQYGTSEEFAEMTDKIREQGKFAMAFIQPVWWHEDSPTMRQLGASGIAEVAKYSMGGIIEYEELRLGDQSDWGYYISPSSPIVRNKYDEIHNTIFETYGCDMVYEDVLGAPYGAYDFNQYVDSPDDFYNEWFELAKKQSQYLLSAEGAYDRMAEYLFGSMASNYQTDGEESEWGYKPGKQNWRPYPTGTILYNDKMINFAYWTPPVRSKDVIGWNIFFSSPLNMHMSTYDTGEHEWKQTAHEFQAHVNSRIIGKQMTDFTELSSTVYKGVYEDITVIRNWDESNQYVYDEHTLATDGLLVLSSNNDLVAGILSSFNGHPLTSGDHFLIVQADGDSIVVRHPRGNDTPIKIDRPSNWTEVSGIHVYAELETGREEITPTIDANHIQFNVNRMLSGNTVLKYKITYGTPSSVDDISQVPIEFSLFQNYPNPFNSNTIIRYHVPNTEHIKLKVYNISGQEIRTLKDAIQEMGKYTSVWDGKDNAGLQVPSGLFIIKLEAGQHMRTVKMLIIK